MKPVPLRGVEPLHRASSHRRSPPFLAGANLAMFVGPGSMAGEGTASSCHDAEPSDSLYGVQGGGLHGPGGAEMHEQEAVEEITRRTEETVLPRDGWGQGRPVPSLTVTVGRLSASRSGRTRRRWWRARKRTHQTRAQAADIASELIGGSRDSRSRRGQCLRRAAVEGRKLLRCDAGLNRETGEEERLATGSEAAPARPPRTPPR